MIQRQVELLSVLQRVLEGVPDAPALNLPVGHLRPFDVLVMALLREAGYAGPRSPSPHLEPGLQARVRQAPHQEHLRKVADSASLRVP